MKKTIGMFGLLLLLLIGAVPGAALAAEGSLGRAAAIGLRVQVAEFRGDLIGMDEVWDSAQACLVWPDRLQRPECFDSEDEMDRRIAELEDGDTRRGQVVPPGGTVAAVSQCSGWLRLYDGANYTGQTMSVRVRLQWLNLASFGFDQKTSSFRIGPCSAYFADWANGGGNWYPTNLTGAYDSAKNMISGWDNDVSSIYIV